MCGIARTCWPARRLAAKRGPERREVDAIDPARAFVRCRNFIAGFIMTDTRVSPLRGFASFVRAEQDRLTNQWMHAVSIDADLVEADKLTYQQLADHLPEILEG